jgi:hypothetical protein
MSNKQNLKRPRYEDSDDECEFVPPTALSKLVVISINDSDESDSGEESEDEESDDLDDASDNESSDESDDDDDREPLNVNTATLSEMTSGRHRIGDKRGEFIIRYRPFVDYRDLRDRYNYHTHCGYCLGDPRPDWIGEDELKFICFA